MPTVGVHWLMTWVKRQLGECGWGGRGGGTALDTSIPPEFGWLLCSNIMWVLYYFRSVRIVPRTLPTFQHFENSIKQSKCLDVGNILVPMLPSRVNKWRRVSNCVYPVWKLSNITYKSPWSPMGSHGWEREKEREREREREICKVTFLPVYLMWVWY